MKCVLLLSIVIAVCAANVIRDPGQGYKEGDRFFYFAGEDGELHLVDAEEPADLDFIEEYTRNPANNAYWLYTRSNPNSPQIIRLRDANSVRNSNFVFSRITVFIAHGWNGSGGSTVNRLLVPAFLQRGDFNVIVLDWNALANRSYNTAKAGTAEVGRGLGQFVNWLVGLGMSLDRVHLVGFSLGGHLVGNAGRAAGGRVRRITALDPAGPLWGSDRNRLVRTDARYVEVIHTDIHVLGFEDPCGDADFYPNGGALMPGCVINTCSHSRAYEYMASSVRYNHLQANQCANMREATRDRCNGNLNPMGNSDMNKSRAGIFRVNTRRSYPF